MKEREFEETCLEPGRLRPIPSVTDRERFADGFRRLADRKFEAARILLGTGVEEEVVGEAHFAMEHKANEYLARNGWRSKSHVCTIAALSKLLKRPDLAETLQKAYHDRQVFDYNADPGAMESAGSFAEFLELAKRFREAIDEAMAGV